MRRRETYATTGPRMTVGFFGGWNVTDADAAAGDLASIGYKKGVPMGSDLPDGSRNNSPTFLIAALKDSIGANLDRVQVIKRWVDFDGKTQERIYDVAVSDGRIIGAELAMNRRDTLTWHYPVAVSASFGLLHGFGFASALRDIGLPQTEIPTALMAFNLGVEIGQVMFAMKKAERRGSM